MGDYKLIMLNDEMTFNIHIISCANYKKLALAKPNTTIVTLMEDTKSRCSFLYKALLSSETIIQDTYTGKYYKTILQKAIERMNIINTSDKRVIIDKLDLSVFASMWSRLITHFPEFNKSNELIVNAELGTYHVYPNKSPSCTFQIETDNPELDNDLLDFRSVSTDGLISELQLLSDKSSPNWRVRYTVKDATVTCIKTETVDRLKLERSINSQGARKYKYEFLSSIEDAVMHIIMETFEPKWY